MTLLVSLLVSWLALVSGQTISYGLSTYTNPTLSGWNSDPSCVFVAEWDSTFFCSTSSFMAYPGLPVYVYKDLINWRHIGDALVRQSQIPKMESRSIGQQDGSYAPTLRYRDGRLYLTTTYFRLGTGQYPEVKIVVYTTSNPYESTSWSDPVIMQTSGLDPDIFWDDDGQAYMSYATIGIQQAPVNLTDGTVGQPISIWNGTGGRNAEGPHIYKKDGFYYLMISEGGTELNHSVTISRSTTVTGPYNSYVKNPVLTNRGTKEYFQTVGHADLFQDKSQNWWGMALATRSGPQFEIYPMGRETVLFPVYWGKGRWPEMQPVRGRMKGPLPPKSKRLPGSGPFYTDAEHIDFSSGISSSFVTWRPQWRTPSLFQTSPQGHKQTLCITPSRANLTGDSTFDPDNDGLAFVARKQTSTLFQFSVNLLFSPEVQEEEAGVTVFLTQLQHFSLGVVNLVSSHGKLTPHLRFRIEASGKPGIDTPKAKVLPIPSDWEGSLIRLTVSTPDDKTFAFSASCTKSAATKMELGQASGNIVSGGSGPFTGTLLGVYATSNGGKGVTPAYFSRWTYLPISQKVAEGDETYVGNN
ncbi:Non-reducing end alpha-L-arabinofuranosidase BoGH43A [Fusarium oxysporum f. sp. cubense]|uniref:Non-reducing end alpha-L-arabinofuranosidase BoGH43A n=1 Tax=Fusarium oxysporum f. sp. cubense TaxID=61366 RepID=A0A559L424_FUSOC|nr:Non-reducing end alpha-L-arabinofuranosidase BoGH43A [Fusarium oxysporum f. sp. cubense]